MNLLNNDIILRKYKDEDTLWVSQRLVMQVCGISESILRDTCRKRFKKHLPKGIKIKEFLPDVGKSWRWARVKGQFYYDYDRIPDRKPTHYRSKLGTKYELLQQYEALLSTNKNKTADLIESEILKKVESYINNKDIHYYMFDAATTFIQEEAVQMTRAKAWFLFLENQLENDRFKLLGIPFKNDFYSICANLIAQEQIKGFKVESAEYLRLRIDKFIKVTENDLMKQLNFIISGKYGNLNALIVGKYPIVNEETGEIFKFDVHQALMYNLYMRPGKITKEYLRSLWENEYSKSAVEFGLRPVSYRTFCDHLGHLDKKNLMNLERHGKDYFRKKILTYTPSEPLSYSHSLFCGDGSGTINYQYIDSSGKQNTKKLYVMFISDVASKKIVGWAPAPVGYSGESGQMMKDAVKMAIENTGKQTMFEFISDNGSAFSSGESEAFLKMIFNKVRTIQPGNSQANPAETMFRLFKQSLKDRNSFISSSWKVGIEGQSNPDYLSYDNLPNYQDACILMHHLIKRWNDRTLRDGTTPNELYKKNIHPSCTPIDSVVLRYLFGEKTEVTLNEMRGFVKVSKAQGYHNRQEHLFEIPDYAGEGFKEITKSVKNKYSVKVKVFWDENEADLYTLEGKYIMTCPKALKSIQAHAEMTEKHQNALGHHENRKKEHEEHISEFQQAVGEAIAEIDYLQMMALGGNKESYNNTMVEFEANIINNHIEANQKRHTTEKKSKKTNKALERAKRNSNIANSWASLNDNN